MSWKHYKNMASVNKVKSKSIKHHLNKSALQSQMCVSNQTICLWSLLSCCIGAHFSKFPFGSRHACFFFFPKVYQSLVICISPRRLEATTLFKAGPLMKSSPAKHIFIRRCLKKALVWKGGWGPSPSQSLQPLGRQSGLVSSKCC